MVFKVHKEVIDLIKNRWAISCLGILAFQQILEASSTYWLVLLIAAITKGEAFFLYIILYLVTLAFPYIPLCVAYIFKISWKQEAQRSFTNAFIKSNKDNISEWNNKGIKEQKLSILTSEGPNTIHLFIDYLWEFWTYVLSVTFNLLALSAIVEPLFALAYALSVTCVVVVMKLKRRAQRQLTKKALTARIELCQSLLTAWDNILLGNDYNFNLWNEKTTERLDRCLQRNVALERFDQFLAIFVTLITAIPSVLVVIYYMMKHQYDPVELSAFVVILPLLFMILSYTHQTLSLAFRWTMHRSKLHTIYKSIQEARDLNSPLERKVKWGRLSFSYTADDPKECIPAENPQAIMSYTELLSRASQCGRLTVRGENGSGKSTMLILIKKALTKRAFYLPTHNHLNFISETNKHSTGESLKNRLIEILNCVEADVLLLDEWDANLDKENREKLSALIDELSLKKCVIEVCHR